MMKVAELVNWLDGVLHSAAFDDSAVNGLQVEATDQVERIAVAVDASLEAVEQAVAANAQLLICHHGLLWGSPAPLVGPMASKLQQMFRSGLSLYASHLPLDAHPELGNNACLARLLGLVERLPFGVYRGQKIGFVGTLETEQPVTEVLRHLEDHLGRVAGTALHGAERIRRVAVVSGAAGDMVGEAVREGVDLLISGEVEHTAAVFARDHRFNLAFFGHWATETLGVRSLAEAINQQFGLPWSFVGSSTGF